MTSISNPFSASSSTDSVPEGLQSQTGTRKPKIDLLALDLDGTLLDEQFHISTRVTNALAEAVRCGVRVTIATGRPVGVTRPFVQAVGVNAPAICMQGGVIYDFAAEKTLHQLSLPHDLGCALTGLERQYPAWQAVVYAPDALYVSSIRYEMNFYAALLGANLTVGDDLCAALNQRDPLKILYIVPPQDAPLALCELKKVAGERAVVVQSHALFVEVNPPEAHKGAGLARLAAALGIPRERVMAIGDQDNDATMLAWAGVGVVMGNGSPASKAAADWVAPPIAEDGVAVAIERFILAR
ncbi:MAG TPA: Cof-type HAD-IIB family hydrolase [Anaerolineae bacterium]